MSGHTKAARECPACSMGHSHDCALVAELERVRALVKQAYLEGGNMNPPGVGEQEWKDSTAKLDLDRGTGA